MHPYNWHWFRTWGTGEVHNNGTHEIDICRWALGVDLPETVTSIGGKYTYDDDWEFVDNQQLTYTFEGDKFITWTGHSRGLMKPERPGRGATIYGSKRLHYVKQKLLSTLWFGWPMIKEVKEASESATTNTRGEGNLDLDHVAIFSMLSEKILLKMHQLPMQQFQQCFATLVIWLKMLEKLLKLTAPLAEL